MRFVGGGAFFSSWLDGCVNRFCRAELSSGDDSRVCVWVCFYSGLSLDMFIVYSRGGSGLLDFWTGWLAG